MYDFSYMQDQDDLEEKLAQYKREHQTLDDAIDRMTTGSQPVNLFEIQQMKKKKLWLRDMIRKIESALIDDIIA